MKQFFLKLKSLFQKQDLTSGNPTKGILIFFIPIFLSTVFQQLFTLTDATIVGQALQQESVAAINASTSINFIVINFGMGCASGFSILLSKHVGAKNVIEARRSYLTQLILCVFVSIFISVAGILLIPVFLSMLGITKNTSDSSMLLEFNEARTYLIYLFAGSVSIVYYNMAVANLRAKGDSFAAFVFLAGGVIINIFLDFLFIYPLKMGVAGSALATVISQALTAVSSLIYAGIKYEEFRPDFKHILPSFKDFLEHLKNGVPLGFQFSILGFGIISMTSGVIAFDINPDGSFVNGIPAQIGYGAACKIINFLLTPLSALGTALISYVSQNYGAKRFDRIKQGMKSATIIGLVLTLIMNAIGLPLLINGFYQYMFLSKEKVSEASILYGNTYLLLSIPTLFFLTFLFIFRGVLQGLEKPMFAFIGGLTELFARIFACSILPYIVYGEITSSSPMSAYYMVASGDWFAWLAGAIAMMIPAIIYLKRYLRTQKNMEA